MEPKRINYTDIAKGIGIILVIFGHTLRGVPGLVNFIYSFHVPLFFVISGFFYSPSKNDNTKLFILKKVKTLLIPFFSFYLLSYLYWFFVEQSFRPSTSTELRTFNWFIIWYILQNVHNTQWSFVVFTLFFLY